MQEEILNFLKKKRGKRYSAEQLIYILKGSKSIYNNLKKIRKEIDQTALSGYQYEVKASKGRGQQKAWVYYYEKHMEKISEDRN